MLLGERITQIRKSKGLSQGELAQKLHIHQSIVTRWEKGHIQPKRHTVERIAEALETPVEELLALRQAPPEALQSDDPELAKLVSQIHRLDARDREALKAVLDAMLTRSRVHEALLRP